MMFRTVAAKALLGASALAAVGGTTVLAATPGAAAAVQQAVAGAHHKKHADVRHGVVTAITDSQLTIESHHRDKATRADVKDDTTFELTTATRVYRAGSKDAVGREQIKVGERVRVRFAEKDGKKVATRVVIERDLRAGKVLSKGDGYFVIHTRDHGDVKVTVNDKTRYITSDGKKGKDRKDGSFAGLKVGDRAIALGEEDSQHNFDAVAVRYHDAPAGHQKAPAAPAAQ